MSDVGQIKREKKANRSECRRNKKSNRRGKGLIVGETKRVKEGEKV